MRGKLSKAAAAIADGDTWRDAAFMAGLGLALYGVYLAYPPLAIGLAGLGLSAAALAWGVIVERRRNQKGATNGDNRATRGGVAKS